MIIDFADHYKTRGNEVAKAANHSKSIGTAFVGEEDCSAWRESEAVERIDLPQFEMEVIGWFEISGERSGGLRVALKWKPHVYIIGVNSHQNPGTNT
jgi:hypothetical protein